MKPLAIPALGGMVSSLLHVLIVTPVILTWLREREISVVLVAAGTVKPEVTYR
jgi:copper/silver efflux system protein